MCVCVLKSQLSLAPQSSSWEICPLSLYSSLFIPCLLSALSSHPCVSFSFWTFSLTVSLFFLPLNPSLILQFIPFLCFPLRSSFSSQFLPEMTSIVFFQRSSMEVTVYWFVYNLDAAYYKNEEKMKRNQHGTPRYISFLFPPWPWSRFHLQLSERSLHILLSSVLRLN